MIAVADAGMDPMRYLKSRDPLEIAIMAHIARKYAEFASKRDEARAVKIANAVGKMLGG